MRSMRGRVTGSREWGYGIWGRSVDAPWVEAGSGAVWRALMKSEGWARAGVWGLQMVSGFGGGMNEPMVCQPLSML